MIEHELLHDIMVGWAISLIGLAVATVLALVLVLVVVRNRRGNKINHRARRKKDTGLARALRDSGVMSGGRG
jgi:predicted MFS family arabinose efflux permease